MKKLKENEVEKVEPVTNTLGIAPIELTLTGLGEEKLSAVVSKLNEVISHINKE